MSESEAGCGELRACLEVLARFESFGLTTKTRLEGELLGDEGGEKV